MNKKTMYKVGSRARAGIEVPCPFCILCRHNENVCDVLVKIPKGEAPACLYKGPVDQEVIEAYINLALAARYVKKLDDDCIWELSDEGSFTGFVEPVTSDVYKICFHSLKSHHCSA